MAAQAAVARQQLRDQFLGVNQQQFVERVLVRHRIAQRRGGQFRFEREDAKPQLPKEGQRFDRIGRPLAITREMEAVLLEPQFPDADRRDHDLDFVAIQNLAFAVKQSVVREHRPEGDVRIEQEFQSSRPSTLRL